MQCVNSYYYDFVSSVVSSECVGNGLDERYRPGEFVQPVQEQGRREERLPVMNGGKDEGEFDLCVRGGVSV